MGIFRVSRSIELWEFNGKFNFQYIKNSLDKMWCCDGIL